MAFSGSFGSCVSHPDRSFAQARPPTMSGLVAPTARIVLTRVCMPTVFHA
jgi:hypothetical protein